MDHLELIMTCVVLLTCQQALGYHEGPPISTHPEICGTMLPAHEYDPQPNDDKLPFEIVTDVDCFDVDGVRVTVRLNGVKKDTYFEGVFVQGRNSKNDAVGVFSTTDDTMSPLDCGDKQKNAIGHNQKDHYDHKTFTWTPPDCNPGKITFRGTIVHETEEFWVGVEADAISACAAFIKDACPTTTTEGPATTTRGPALRQSLRQILIIVSSCIGMTFMFFLLCIVFTASTGQLRSIGSKLLKLMPFLPVPHSQKMPVQPQPPQQKVQPLQQKVQPLQQKVQPLQQKVQPLQQKVQPPQQEVQPLQQKVQPLQQKVQPLQQMVQPPQQEVQPPQQEV